MISKTALEAIFKNSLKLKKTESCLIITDKKQSPVALQFYNYASQISLKTKLKIIKPLKEDGQEPPKSIASLMKIYQVVLLITSKSLTHTKARKNASKNKARIASMPNLTESTANRTLNIDYKRLEAQAKSLRQLILNSKEITITTKLGTKISAKIIKERVHLDTGLLNKPGYFGNLPAGEVGFSPSKVNGTLIIDGTCPDIKLKSPIKFTIKQSYVINIQGDKSYKIKKRLDRVGKKAYFVAEIGIGLNPKARIIGNILEDEKVLGTFHLALGSNISYKGNNNVPIHLDYIIKNPTIYLDKKEIMRNGKFLNLQNL